MSKARLDPRGWKDWTLPVSIEAQVVERLSVDIVAQSIPTLAIDIKAQSLPTLNVNIASSQVTLNVNIASSSVTLNMNIVNEVVPTGQVKSALAFDGVNDYVNCGHGDGTQIGGTGASFSIVMICRRKTSGVRSLIVFQGTAGTDTALHIGYRSSDLFTFAFYADDLDTPEAYPDVNVKVIWTCTYDASTKTQKIYRFKELVASRTANGDYVGSGDLFIGQAFGVYYFKGDIYLVLLYKGRALTQEEVNMINDDPYSPPTTNLTGFWKFDEGVGNIVRDYAGYDDNGTIYGATWVSEEGSVSPTLNVNIVAQSIGNLNVNIASSSITLNVAIQSSAVTFDVNIQAQTVDLKVLTGSGARVVVGIGLITRMASFSWSSAGSDFTKVLDISGKGRMNSIALKVYRSDASYTSWLRVVVIADGVEVLNCRLYVLDAINARGMSYALRAGTSSSPAWGEAPWVSKLGGIVWAQGWVANRNTINEYPACIELGALLTPDVEFNSSLQVWLYNDYAYSMLILGGLSYGLYP